MSTFSTLEVRQIPLFLPRRRAEWEALLRAHDLTPSEAIVAAGLYDADDRLRGCASLCRCGAGLSIQCVAMDEGADEHGQVGRMIDFLRAKAAEDADGTMPDLFLFTKPEYEKLFASLAFRTVGRAPKAVLLESDARALRRYTDYLTTHRREGRNGVIVMNANPFTLGHLYLVQQAAAQVDNLYIIPVLDEGATESGKMHYPYELRCRAIRAAVADMPNVTVPEGSRYAISAATFPNYFIKTLTEVTDNQIALDLDIFATHIAPALGATVRFVGSEPSDKLTARYNALLHETLPKRGVEVVEIERLKASEAPVSASRVRANVSSGQLLPLKELLPQTTLTILLGDLAIRALMTELDLDPKPGLVTPTSNGAHADMDYKLMRKAIEALRPSFETFVSLGLEKGVHADLVAAGLKAEEDMMHASGGVNTHRGAIFSLGLMLTAAASLLGRGEEPDAPLLQAEIKRLAEPFKPQSDSNGAGACRQMPLRSALDMARTGYAELFANWLPFYRDARKKNMPLQTALLNIMRTLDDTNLVHRGGPEALGYVRGRAAETLSNLTDHTLRALCSELQSRNLSPGGSADMLALTLLANSLLN